MDIAIERLNRLFVPYDMRHLLLLWVILTAFLCIAALIIRASGIYRTSRQFLGILVRVLAGAYLLSGVCFLLFHVNAIFTIMSLLCLAFVLLGDVGINECDIPLEDWWLSLLLVRKRAPRDPE